MGAVVRLEQVSLSVESRQLLDGASAHIVQGQRVAVVGANGCGKTTLLRAIARACGVFGEESYFTVGAGRIEGSQALLVEQDALQWSALLEGTEDEVRSLTVADALLDEDDAENWRRLSVVAERRLGWHGYDETPIGELSPGSAVRAYLAVALHRRDLDVLLLDEPTNHLDLPSMLWLRAAIKASGKAVVVVSHDTAFLDAVCDHVWSINKKDQSLVASGAAYSDVRRSEELARQHHMAAYEAQTKRNAQLSAAAEKLREASARGERAVAKDNDTFQRGFRRDRAGRSGKKAKALDKLRDSQATVEKVTHAAGLKLDFAPLGAGFDASILFDSLRIARGSRPLPLPPLSGRIAFGERVAVVGPNGIGKSTLLATITGSLAAVDGTASVGRDLRLGHLTQEHENLPRDTSAREFAADQGGGLPVLQARAYVIRYGLTRHQAEAPISSLNPGARLRLLFAVFALRSVNALVLDEPTNHADSETIAELTATLNAYEGTVLVVSHSVDFLRSLDLSRVLKLTPDDGLAELDSIDAFVDDLDDAVADVIAKTWH